MKTFDWIVVGAGITGAALAYELVCQGFSVLLLERHSELQGGTRFGYGGIAYWAGTTPLTRSLCAEGIAIHRSLSAELDSNTEFRELDLVMPIFPDEDREDIFQLHQQFAIAPQQLTVAEACELEPLLNPAAFCAALTIKHGHVNVMATAHAYTQAFLRRGGIRETENVTGLMRGNGQVNGVHCDDRKYHSANVAIAAGGLSRSFLQNEGITVRQYFTHSEQLETLPVDLTFRSIIMPANVTRFRLEATASQNDEMWDHPGHEPAPAILDVGGVQYLDGSIKMGQLSRTLTDPHLVLDAASGEAALRDQIGTLLPALRDLPAQHYHCLVAFTSDRLPLVGQVANIEGLHLFSGFSNPLALVPAIARRFAKMSTGRSDELLMQLSPNRFATKI
jgi:glycine/D-amino acid oxidase-like deaminating enzyme